MSADEKKQIYLDRFPANIGRRMADQFDEGVIDIINLSPDKLISYFTSWSKTNEKEDFWYDIYYLYLTNETIEHQQILDIFHKHNIEP